MAVGLGYAVWTPLSFGTSVSSTGGTTASTGSTFVVAVVSSAAPTVTVTDNFGNTYTLQKSVSYAFANDSLYLFTCINGAGGAGHSATANLGANGEHAGIAFAEFTGVGAGTIDSVPAGIGPNATATTQTAPSITTTVAGELVVNAFSDNNSNNAETITDVSPFAIAASYGTATFLAGALTWAAPASTGAYADTVTLSIADYVGALALSIKPAAGGGTTSAIVGTDAATATNNGALAVANAFSGSLGATATLSAPLSVAAALQGSQSATATTAGSLGLTTAIAVSGNAKAVATNSGSLALSLAISGQIGASATDTASLTNAIGLAGVQGANGAVTGVLANQIAISAGSFGVGSLSATFGPAQAALYGSSAAAATFSGTLGNAVGLGGTSGAKASNTGVIGIGTALALSGITSATATNTGALSVSMALSAASQAASTYSGVLGQASGVIVGIQGAAASFSGNLAVWNALSATALSSATFQGSLILGTLTADVLLIARAANRQLTAKAPNNRLIRAR